MNPDNVRIAIIGLGYVGLPLAVEFGRHFPTMGFDLKQARIDELRAGQDSTLETTADDLKAAKHLGYTTTPDDLAGCNVYIVTVPTPIDRYKRPDLTPLEKASETVGRLLKPGDLVIYESTVYPGCTEEVCVPILEQTSGLEYLSEDRHSCGQDSPAGIQATDGNLALATQPVSTQGFFVGYSPERINPGDKEHRLTTIKKITAGSTREAAALVDALYRRIIEAGTHPATSIRVAEAAKVIENTQRDVNIALINELAMLFQKLGIDTSEVLAAAGSKWNFLPFRPGLVGGHCIGVDPYYLTHKAQEIGYHPEMILAGRRINDQMGQYVAGQVAKLMMQRQIPVSGSKILILGLTFKENCPDLRNTRVVDIIDELQSYGAEVEVHDPWIDRDEARHEYSIDVLDQPDAGRYDAIVLAVAHDEFRQKGVSAIRGHGRPGAVLYDVKHLFPVHLVDGRL
ncbi:nucleotide sugar dehydrogenase [Methylococcus mesophilus]|uniref:nucleotide sugar dehydrogenase n=1 Tax=Methylococcus mesophilus TaxID=2993564 RepID=UPI00224AB88D|nr:nucleotide sugar dehydrogenase [Methylococcus mesophilus]UZR28716.1 nucleotide sugar dehydrogenase [Methylococcus mesophilus]